MGVHLKLVERLVRLVKCFSEIICFTAQHLDDRKQLSQHFLLLPQPIFESLPAFKGLPGFIELAFQLASFCDPLPLFFQCLLTLIYFLLFLLDQSLKLFLPLGQRLQVYDFLFRMRDFR